ncbi:hypothetical protein FJ366_01960 [Candidatus Dependentiae bacterium]|nr:hypothetical protein [Candidatus Dependentiae bacterium]
MQKIRLTIFKLIAAALCCSSTVQAVYNSNLAFTSNDHISKAHGSHVFKFGANLAYARASTDGYNNETAQVGALQIYSPTESARAMLIDYDQLQVLSSTATADFPYGLDWSLWDLPLGLGSGWGDMRVKGSVKQSTMTLWGRALVDYGTIPGQFFLGIAVPLCKASVSGVVFEDLTDVTADGARNRAWKTNLTSKIQKYVQAAGGLDLYDWSKNGAGDTHVYFGWGNSYAKGDGSVSKIDIHASVGLWLPTGCQRSVDHAFSTAFGNDGSYGVPLNLGMSIVFGEHLKLSSDLEVAWLSAKTKEYRLKTDAAQTDYLILTKGTATKKPGAQWKMTTEGVYRCSDSCKLRLAHNFVRREKSVFTQIPEKYNLDVVNTLGSLKASESQDLTVRGDFSGRYGANEDDREGNELSFSIFYTIPINGQNAVKHSIVGGDFHFSF